MPDRSQPPPTLDRHYRQIVQSAIDYAIIGTDCEGRVVSWNEGARRILGWSAQDMLGQGLHRIFTPEDRAAGAVEREMEQAQRSGKATDERWHQRSDGERFWASGELMPLGSDTGAVGNGLVEKDLNFDIGYWHLRPRLESDGRIDQVWMTRTGDYDVSLAYRADLASASGANLFVSLHNNAHLISSRGTETYYKCGSEASEAVRIQSKRAACLVHSRVQEAIMQFGSPSCPWFDRGVICRMISLSDPRSYYYVLRNSTVPTLLVEFLFVSNPNEALCLGNHTFRDMMAEAVYSGITDALFTDLPGDSCNFKTYYGL